MNQHYTFTRCVFSTSQGFSLYLKLDRPQNLPSKKIELERPLEKAR